ncbi:unnamed protein product [Ranitomeya imitator]|uniref:Uncharacterized protein n=1 Tax=Ranitomeya imitator TaxID=111125 RepID=A0ABN9LQT1_9NEOB|nr:unnamed protein product [Ranitomeya imitator]
MVYFISAVVTPFPPPSTKNSIPKSQFQRVDRIVSNDNIKKIRLSEMEDKFCNIGGVLSKAKLKTSQDKSNKGNKRIPFVTTFHPFSGMVQSTIRRHWNILTKSYPLIPEFKSPFLSCFRRAKNLKDRLVKADVGPETTLARQTFLQTQTMFKRVPQCFTHRQLKPYPSKAFTLVNLRL